MAADQDPQKSGSTGDSTIALWVLGAAAAFLVAIPAAIGIAVWMACRRYAISKREWAVLGAGGLLAVLIGGLFADYGVWLKVLVTGEGNRLDVPWLSLLALGAVCASVAGMIEGTAIASKVLLRANKDPFERDRIVPDAKTRDAIKLASVPGEALTPHVSSHSLTDPSAPGERAIPLGVDQRGRPVLLAESEIKTHVLLFGSTGSGKALALDTPIPTPSGWTSMGELAPGDVVFDEAGRPCNVTFATGVQYERDCFEVAFSDGSTIVADGDHRWLTDTQAPRMSPAQVRTTTEIASSLRIQGRTNHSIAVAGALETEPADLPIHPYVLGAWLGDGNSYHGGLTSADAEIVERIAACGHEVRRWRSGPNSWGICNVMPALRRLGLLKVTARDRGRHPDGAKRIPPCYLRASINQRLELLRGLMDTDGTISRTGSCTWSSASESLADDFYELVVSLGIQARRRVAPSFLDGVRKQDAHVVSFTTDLPVFHLSRKRDRLPAATRPSTQRRFITDVRPIESVPVRCIQVDSPSHLYLAGRSMTPTHNTETIKALAGGLLDLGWEGMILDLKEDTANDGLLDWCETYANHHALPFQELCLSNPNPSTWFNPLAGLSPDEARDAILGLQEFEAPYYKALNQKQLGQLTNLLYWAHEVDPTQFAYPTPLEMGRVLSASSLQAAVRKHVAIVTTSVPGTTKEDFQSLNNPSKPEADAAPGLGARLTAMYDTQAGRTVLRAGPNRHELDVTAGGLIYVGLDSQGKPDLTKMISSAMLQRLSAFAAQRTTGRVGHNKDRPRFLIVDEANWVDRQIIQNLLSRARGAGISMVLATQGPRDWIDARGDDFAKLGQNTNVAIIMSQGEPTSAEICADYIGKEEYMAVTRRIEDGGLYDVGSARADVAHRVTPDQLRALEVGEAIVRVGKPSERYTWVKIQPRDPKAQARR